MANPMAVRAIASAKAKTDRLDARTLARLLQAGFLPAVWMGDERTRLLRRLVSRHAQLVKQRTRAKNQVHAVLQRT
jgi:transposase